MPTHPISFVDEGVDYLTCTFNSRAPTTKLLLAIGKVERAEIALNNFMRPWGMAGYVGQKVGGLEYGHRHDGLCVRLVGPTAQRWWHVFGKLATNCSRIDLQRTALFDEPYAKTVHRFHRQMRRYWLKRKQFPEPKEIRGANGAESVYSGDRTSETYLRLYHRGSKRGFENCVGHIRFEAELKGDRARLTLRELLSNRQDKNYLVSQVQGYFEKRGASLRWFENSPSTIVCPRPLSDLEKSLRWLDTAVRPTVERLIALNREEDVFRALGFIKDGPHGPNNSEGE